MLQFQDQNVLVMACERVHYQNKVEGQLLFFHLMTSKVNTCPFHSLLLQNKPTLPQALPPLQVIMQIVSFKDGVSLL